MPSKVRIDLSSQGGPSQEMVPLTPEEETQRATDAAAQAVVDAKAASDTTNASALEAKAAAALASLEDAIANWGTLTNAQKDAAMKLTVRSAATLIRLHLRKLDTQGV